MIVPSEFATTCTSAEAIAVLSAALVALTVIQENGSGKADGAVYSPLLSTVPKGPDPPGTSFTDQVTLLLPLPITAAVKWTVFPNSTVDLAGDTVI